MADFTPEAEARFQEARHQATITADRPIVELIEGSAGKYRRLDSLDDAEAASNAGKTAVRVVGRSATGASVTVFLEILKPEVTIANLRDTKPARLGWVFTTVKPTAQHNGTPPLSETRGPGVRA